MNQPMPPQPQPAAPKKKKSKKTQKTDPFWPIVIILSILAFAGSFWFFYMLTSKINTRSFDTTDKPKLMVTATPYELNGETRTVDYGPVPTPTPSEEIIVPSASPTTVSATASPTLSGTPTAEPSTLSTLAPPETPPPQRTTPRPVVTLLATPTPLPVKKIGFRVQVGAYTNREAAQKVATELSDKGYSATVSEDNGKYRIQLGTYSEQESAMTLAEEVTQQGYAVVVRKVDL